MVQAHIRWHSRLSICVTKLIHMCILILISKTKTGTVAAVCCAQVFNLSWLVCYMLSLMCNMHTCKNNDRAIWHVYHITPDLKKVLTQWNSFKESMMISVKAQFVQLKCYIHFIPSPRCRSFGRSLHLNIADHFVLLLLAYLKRWHVIMVTNSFWPFAVFGSAGCVVTKTLKKLRALISMLQAMHCSQ